MTIQFWLGAFLWGYIGVQIKTGYYVGFFLLAFGQKKPEN
jgi:hypothetical protein